MSFIDYRVLFLFLFCFLVTFPHWRSTFLQKYLFHYHPYTDGISGVGLMRNRKIGTIVAFPDLHAKRVKKKTDTTIILAALVNLRIEVRTQE